MEESERTVLFTNTYTTDEKTDRQMFRRIRRIPRLIVFLLCGVFIAYFIYWLIQLLTRSTAQSGESLLGNPTALLGLALCAVLIVRELLAPGTFSKRQANRLKELYDTEHITIEARFSDDAIVFFNHASHGDMDLPYSSLNLLTETKELFLIRTKQRQVIALAKNGFAGVDEEGFRSFMQEKCPDAKCTWKKAKTA